MRTLVKRLSVFIIIMVAVNYIAGQWFTRVDITSDNRYTVSKVARELALQADNTVLIDVFLEGELPGEFRKLQSETRQLLEEFKSINPNIKYEFVNPLQDLDAAAADQVTRKLAQYGIKPALATIFEAGKSTKVKVFPWAIMVHKDKTTAIPLLKTVARATTEERVNSSIQQLEYQFASGLSKVTTNKDKTIAFLRDPGSLKDIEINDLIKSLQEYYRIAPFGIEFVTTTDSVRPKEVLDQLKRFDLVIDPKPTIAYSETKKYIIDQYIMNGGKFLLAADPIIFENDSLANPEGVAYGLNRELGIDEMLFKYGLRLNTGMLKDERSGYMALATGQGRNTQYDAFKWPYYPISKSYDGHPITKNLEEVKFEYTGSIDTLKNGINKTILLKSSDRTTVKVLPAKISLQELDQPIDPLDNIVGEKALAVLAKGSFTSAYRNRITPFSLDKSLEKSKETAIVLIADGDIMKNQIDRGKPQELGYDIRTGALYGNKEFLMNTVNYLLDDTGLMNLRTKEVKVAFLNPEKSYKERSKWQLINGLAPLIVLGIIGVLFTYFKKRKYSVSS